MELDGPNIVNLPPEILLKIVTYLDPRNIAMLRATCKHLRQVVPPPLIIYKYSLTEDKLPSTRSLFELPPNTVPIQLKTSIELDDTRTLHIGAATNDHVDKWVCLFLLITHADGSSISGEYDFAVNPQISKCKQMVARKVNNNTIELLLLMFSKNLYKLIIPIIDRANASHFQRETMPYTTQSINRLPNGSIIIIDFYLNYELKNIRGEVITTGKIITGSKPEFKAIRRHRCVTLIHYPLLCIAGHNPKKSS